MNFRKYFMAGLVVMMPAFLTAFIVFKLVQMFLILIGTLFPIWPFVHSMVQGSIFTDNPIVRSILFFMTYIFLAISTIVILTFIGFLTLNYINKERAKWLERLFLKVPFSTTIYTTIKQISGLLLSSDLNYDRVVLIEYPRKGIHSLGFLTNENIVIGKKGEELKERCSVFLPTAPNPISGMFIILKREEIISLDMKVEDAIRLIISGGMLDNFDE